ncbi:MAG: LL-diaminopimelate aminotransferase [Bacteroidaceae bacterium]|nr:LL-diaminopimelate aminotransferase [Bacteroidaceae bacterium]
MAKINEHFLNLSGNYLFAEIAKKVKTFREQNPQSDVISLGIGDVTQPLCPAVIEALHRAVDEMSGGATFRGYGPEQGYDFLREEIARHDYRDRGMDITADEIFVNDGAKSDTGNFQELLSDDCVVAVTDPVYPVYVDSNVMAGRRIVKLPCLAERDFVPTLPEEPVDVVYLCYPNNPTGTVLRREDLQRWVDWAQEHEALIFYDAAYEAFISHPDIPHSIYEIDGARKVAVEFRSFSKTAGFTGLRCGYTVVPHEVTAKTPSGDFVAFHPLWKRRQSTKFNGTSYLSQRAAQAIYSEEGQKQIRETVGYYLQNARLMRVTLECLGLKVYGGTDAPYLWVETPEKMPSWAFFEEMLRQARVVCTPGAGFGDCGEGYVRLTAFGERTATIEALHRVEEWLTNK